MMTVFDIDVYSKYFIKYKLIINKNMQHHVKCHHKTKAKITVDQLILLITFDLTFVFQFIFIY